MAVALTLVPRARGAGRQSVRERDPRRRSRVSSGFPISRLASRATYHRRVATRRLLDWARVSAAGLFLAAHAGEISQAQHRERELAATYRDLRARWGRTCELPMRTRTPRCDRPSTYETSSCPRRAPPIARPPRAMLSGDRRRSTSSTRAEPFSTRETQYADALAAASTSRADLERAVGAPLASIDSGAGMHARTITLAAIVTIVACGSLRTTPIPNRRQRHRTSPSRPAQQARIHVATVAPTQFQPTIADHRNSRVQRRPLDAGARHPCRAPSRGSSCSRARRSSRGTPLALVSSPDFASAIAAYRKAAERRTNLQRIASSERAALQERRDLAPRARAGADRRRRRPSADREAALEQLRALGVESRRRSESGEPLRRGHSRADQWHRRRAAHNTGTTAAGRRDARFTIADLSTVWVMANVFESDLGNVAQRRDGQRLRADVSPTPFSGVVDYVAALVDLVHASATSVRVVVTEPRRSSQARHVRTRRNHARPELGAGFWFLKPRYFATTRISLSCSSRGINGYARRRIALGIARR